MKNKIKNIIPIVAILIVAILLIVLFSERKKASPPNKERIVEDVIQNVFYNDSLSSKELSATINSVLPSDEIFIGKDSYITYKPSNEIIEKYKLESYVAMQDEYAPAVRKKFDENTSYKITSTTDTEVFMDVIPWYYSQYTQDLMAIMNKIMEYAKYEIDETNINIEEYTVNEYKARVLGMRILNSHLDEYDNVTGETRKVLLDYGGGSEPEKNDYYTLYLVLGGVTAEKAPSMEKQEERVNNYIQEAINNNILVTNKPY